MRAECIFELGGGETRERERERNCARETKRMEKKKGKREVVEKQGAGVRSRGRERDAK